MDILSAQALAGLSDDELKTVLVQTLPIADPSTIIATREQLEKAVLEIIERAA